jgi:hypothetical protein
MITAEEARQVSKIRKNKIDDWRVKHDLKIIEKAIKYGMRRGYYNVVIPEERMACINEESFNTLKNILEVNGYTIFDREVYRGGYYTSYEISWGEKVSN